MLMPQPSLYQKLPDLGKVTAVVLAGGRGKRMGALCNTRPKPALPFGGKNRVIDFSLRNCLDSGIENIITLVDYQRAYMSEYIRQWSFENQFNETMYIREPQKGSYLGTADAVYQNLDTLNKTGAEAVMILAADHVYRMGYRDMFDSHRRTGADVTIGVVPVPTERACQFGIIATDSDDRIISFQEKPEKPESNLASMGIYIFNTDILTEHLIKDNLDTDSSHDFGYSVIPRVIANERVFAYRFDGYWQDIGTPEAYYQAHMDLINGIFPFTIGGISGLAYVDNSRNSIIGENCVVNGQVENSILYPGVFVSENATVRNAVVMAKTLIGYSSTVCGCIIDEEVEIGDYAHVGPITPFPAGGNQVSIINRGTIIPSYANMGNNRGIAAFGAYSDIFSGVVLPKDFGDKDLISIVKR